MIRLPQPLVGREGMGEGFFLPQAQFPDRVPFDPVVNVQERFAEVERGKFQVERAEGPRWHVSVLGAFCPS